MSRPCFALSVMLCSLAGPLLIIGQTQARDTVVSPSHDPGECIVCPLAHGPLEACGGYSDYDYNDYWYDEDMPPACGDTACEEPAPPTPELEVAQSLDDGAAANEWESEYEDYYADYVFGEDVTTEDSEEAILEATPAPAALIELGSEPEPTPAAPQTAENDATEGEETSEFYDEYGWYADDADAPADYFDAYENYEPIETAAPDTATPDTATPDTATPDTTTPDTATPDTATPDTATPDTATPDTATPDTATPDDAAIDYEAYEEEWFSYGAEPEAQEELNSEADEAYEALTESASEAAADETIDAQPADESWGDEEAWYYDEYGYDSSFGKKIEEASPNLEPQEELQTTYDEAYNKAMASESEAVETAADIVPASPDVALPAAEPETDDYESYYDAYEDLYIFESTPTEPIESETSEVTAEPVAVDQSRALDSEPAWLAELVDRMLASVWTGADRHASIYMDECAQEWDCESTCWAQAQAEEPSVLLNAADSLDGMAAALQNAAEFLRAVVDGHLAETARVPDAGSQR